MDQRAFITMSVLIGMLCLGFIGNAVLPSIPPMSPEQRDAERVAKLLMFADMCNVFYYKAAEAATKELDNRYGEGAGAKAMTAHKDEIQKMAIESVKAIGTDRQGRQGSIQCPRLAQELGL
jgi:hypothetical protein